MTPRLSTETLCEARAHVRRPAYDRSRLSTGIVHLGLGAFARAHLCAYTEDCIERGGAEHWGIAGVNLRSTEQRDRLLPQDRLYTLVPRGEKGLAPRVIGCLTEVLAGPGATADILAHLAAPATRIVGLTVTEKGYCHDPATGRLDRTHPDIVHDLVHLDAPRSAIGVVVAALARRHAAGVRPLTVLSCDNLHANGRLVAGLVGELAAARSDALARWIGREVAFPSTMVDRIVPATTPDDIETAATLTGLVDAAPVLHEPFTQWVIEDRFVDGARPDWHEVGAMLVADVAPYEAMKLRLLNAAHSALAYLGYLAGHETIGDCMTDPVLRAYAIALWSQEIIPVVPPPPSVDLDQYADALLQRFANPAIRHRTWQIAMDGSQKLPPRLLETVRHRLHADLPVPRLALAVAAWMIYAAGRDLDGRPIDVRDPMAATLAARAVAAGAEPRPRVAAFLAICEIFGEDLPRHRAFVTAVETAMAALTRLGVRGAVAALG